jgi:hypothetical protein
MMTASAAGEGITMNVTRRGSFEARSRRGGVSRIWRLRTAAAWFVLDSRRRRRHAATERAAQSRIPARCPFASPRGMSSSAANPGERIKDVRVTDDALSVDLADGRTITVPLTWFPRLLHATSEQRSTWKISAAGFGIHWPDLDEDLSSEGLLRGAPAAVRGKGAAQQAGSRPLAPAAYPTVTPRISSASRVNSPLPKGGRRCSGQYQMPQTPPSKPVWRKPLSSGR